MRFLFYITGILIVSCSSFPESGDQTVNHRQTALDAPIAEYVVSIFEDTKGNLWFGTVGSGMAMYNGNELVYYTTAEGLPDNTTTDFVEDAQGHLWIATHNGLSKYDGHSFKNYMVNDGLADNRVSELFIDSKGMLWIGTWAGVSQFKDSEISKFEIPYPNIEKYPHSSMQDWVTEITEDPSGNIWIGRDGYGACRYDGTNFTHYTKSEGLTSNSVQEIHIDHLGNTWFGYRITESDHPDPKQRNGKGGVSLFEGNLVNQMTLEQGLDEFETFAITQGKGTTIWFGANKHGVYKYDDQGLALFHKTDRADLMPYGYGVQSILEDSKGNVWIGLSGGLFRLEGDSIKHISKNKGW